LDAIDRYLSKHPAILQHLLAAVPASLRQSEVSVLPPELPEVLPPLPERLRRLIRKFDLVEGGYHNRSPGKAGEELGFDVERPQLAEADGLDLARRVSWGGLSTNQKSTKRLVRGLTEEPSPSQPAKAVISYDSHCINS
jgi:hypothetical protein